ncbi:hypothetical protein CPB83DRAFT_846826 [Crepidotus variabilis]|uniref:Secreted protein n=1 Tax=Crepidotus variabilis TaxID=179855 RepID=A0A9P6ENR0_9AGAR|nr:hypothetical protein CPB83DRAFT_846826 [Crepidotus variabilis]
MLLFLCGIVCCSDCCSNECSLEFSLSLTETRSTAPRQRLSSKASRKRNVFSEARIVRVCLRPTYWTFKADKTAPPRRAKDIARVSAPEDPRCWSNIPAEQGGFTGLLAFAPSFLLSASTIQGIKLLRVQLVQPCRARR